MSESRTPATEDTPAQAGNTPSSDAANNRSSSGNRNRNSNRSSRQSSGTSITVQSTDSSSFEGACPEIGAVAGLRTEKVTKKVPFSVFVEKVADHVITNVKYGSDIEACIRKVQDPFIYFGSRHKPEPLVDGENAPFGDKWLFQERRPTFHARTS